jgi:hypothetical protein
MMTNVTSVAEILSYVTDHCNEILLLESVQVGHTTALTVDLDTGCATLQNNTFLVLGT